MNKCENDQEKKEACKPDISIADTPKARFCDNYSPNCEKVMCEPCHEGRAKNVQPPVDPIK